MADIPNELDYSRKVADGERLELIMRQVASRFKLDGNVLAEALLDIHERLKAVEGATEDLTAPDRWKAFKTVQLAKPSPSASGDTVTAIDTVAQDENGELTATKKNIRQGTTSQTGIVQLSDATDSTSTTLAATANAVKKAYGLAASKQDALGISSSGSSTKFLNEQGEFVTVTSPDVSGKADKVANATAGDVATLDANGNLVDSGKTLGASVPADAAFTDDKVAQMMVDSSDSAYPLLMAGTTDPRGRATVARYDSVVTLDPATNTIAANISGNAATADSATTATTLSSVLPTSKGGTGFSTVDTTPTKDSNKMVTSGGVWNDTPSPIAHYFNTTGIVGIYNGESRADTVVILNASRFRLTTSWLKNFSGRTFKIHNAKGTSLEIAVLVEAGLKLVLTDEIGVSKTYDNTSGSSTVETRNQLTLLAGETLRLYVIYSSGSTEVNVFLIGSGRWSLFQPAVYKSENTTDGCTLTFTAIDGSTKNVTVRNVVNAGNADKVDGYHIVVGSTGTDSNTIYFT